MVQLADLIDIHATLPPDLFLQGRQGAEGGRLRAAEPAHHHVTIANY